MGGGKSVWCVWPTLGSTTWAMGLGGLAAHHLALGQAAALTASGLPVLLGPCCAFCFKSPAPDFVVIGRLLTGSLLLTFFEWAFAVQSPS